jgi:hypothetical protein
MSRSVLDRRQFMKAMGLGGAGLFLPSLVGRRALADGDHCAAGPPKRLLLVYTHHGTVYDRWRIRTNQQPEDQDWGHGLDAVSEAEFSDVLRPLHRWRNKMTVFDGLSMTTAVEEARPNDNLHVTGHSHSLTGAAVAPKDDGFGGPVVGMSVDQIIAAHLADAGRLPSAEFVVGDVEFMQALFSGPRQAVPSEKSAERAFERLFSAVRGSDDGGGQATADPLAAAQGSVLDLVARQYESMAPRLSGEDRRKLESHRDLVRGVEQRLKFLAELACDAPTLGALPEHNDPSGDAYLGRTRAFADIIAAAFSCDLTRVATLTLGLQPNELCEAPPGHIHADYAHQVVRNPAAKEVMTRYSAVHGQQIAELLDTLDSVPEAGGTLLDNTAVVWLGELGTGLHDFQPWPVVVAGGACGAFPMGRYLHYAQDGLSPQSITPSKIGPPHNRFLVSLCQGMGMSDVTRVGHREARTHQGDAIDLTGALHIPSVG